MPEFLAQTDHHDARAAAMARHPTSALPGGASRLEPRLAPPPSFAGVVGVLTGLWRVADPGGFATAMTAAPVVAGHAVLDLAQIPALEAQPLDRATSVLLRALERAAVSVLRSADLEVEWVSGLHAGHLYVEARAQLSPLAGQRREAFVVAHVVESLRAGGRAHRPATVDHSWAVMVLGDGRGGVAGIVRATLSCPARCCPDPGSRIAFALPGFRQRLLGPALAEAGVGGGAEAPAEAVVLPFRRGRR